MSQERQKIVTRKEAQALGLARYFTGSKCKHGHVFERRTHNGECVECFRISNSLRNARYRTEQPEKIREWKRQDYLRNKESHRRRGDKWAKENPEKVKASQRRWRQENKAKFNDMVQEWRRANPAKTRLQKHRRRMLEQTAGGEYTQDDLEAILTAQNGLCMGCGCDIIETFTIDHKTPLSRGGTNDPENIQGLCLGCNSSKGTKTNDEWFRDRDIV